MSRRRSTAGLIVFLTLSLVGSWTSAVALRALELNVQPPPFGTRLFTTALLYALTLGWQPILATWVVRRWIDPFRSLDLGLRPAPWAAHRAGAMAAFGAVTLAMAVTAALSAGGIVVQATPHVAAEAAVAALEPSFRTVVFLSLVLLGSLTLVGAQALAEEVAWRGYFLPQVMGRFGNWRGLLLHATVWGIWYAPVLFVTSYGPLPIRSSAARSLGCVATGVLLGTLLGWLRLVSRSIAPVVTANIVLTLLGGLPYVVHGIDGGARSSIFGPAGWIVMTVGIALLLGSRWRAVVDDSRDGWT